MALSRAATAACITRSFVNSQGSGSSNSEAANGAPRYHVGASKPSAWKIEEERKSGVLHPWRPRPQRMRLPSEGDHRNPGKEFIAQLDVLTNRRGREQVSGDCSLNVCGDIVRRAPTGPWGS